MLSPILYYSIDLSLHNQNTKLYDCCLQSVNQENLEIDVPELVIVSTNLVILLMAYALLVGVHVDITA